MIEEAIRDAQERAHENRLDEKDLQELHELEDEEDEEFLETYRYLYFMVSVRVSQSVDPFRSKQRIQELSTISKSSLHGQVYHLQKLDYARDVTEASKSSFVVVHLQGINTESRLLSNLWRELARKFGDIKFCEIQGDMCIEGYPDKNCPTILVYHDGEVVKQMLTLRDLRGQQTAQHGRSATFHPHVVNLSQVLTRHW